MSQRIDPSRGDAPSKDLVGVGDPTVIRVPAGQTRSWWWVASSGAAALALGIGIVASIWLLARPIGILIIGVSVAALLAPAVNWLSRSLPRWLSVLLIYLALIVLAGGIGFIVVPPIAGQFRTFAGSLPSIISLAQSWLESHNLTLSNQVVNLLTSQISSSLGSLASVPSAVFSFLFDFILIIFISLYGLIVAPSVHSLTLSLFAEEQEPEVDALLRRMASEMGGYLRGAVINGLVIGALTALGLFIIGVEFPLVLGLIAGVFELFPFIGPLIAGIPMVLIALLRSPTTALIATGYVLVLHQFESQILVPNIMRSQTDISPLLVLLAFSAGYTIGGPFGALVAIPFTAALRVLLRDSVFPAIRRRTGAPPAS